MVLITIEGIDGSGKSTLISMLKKKLSGPDVVFTREPGSSWIGEQVRRAVAEESDPVAEALLFMADHAQHLATIVRPSLAAGRLVISDRYSDSRYAYQAVSLDGIITEPLAWLKAVHRGWTVTPDLTYLLVLSPDEAVKRLAGNHRLEHFETEENLKRVQQVYLELAAAEPSRFVIVDALLEKEEIADFIAEDIRRHVKP
jgi:dTMP kinase